MSYVYSLHLSNDYFEQCKLQYMKVNGICYVSKLRGAIQLGIYSGCVLNYPELQTRLFVLSDTLAFVNLRYVWFCWFLCPRIDRSGAYCFGLSVCLSQNFKLASKMHTCWCIFFKLHMQVVWLVLDPGKYSGQGHRGRL